MSPARTVSQLHDLSGRTALVTHHVNAILPGVFPSRMARHLLAPGTIEPIVVLLPVDGGASAVVGA